MRSRGLVNWNRGGSGWEVVACCGAGRRVGLE